MFLAILTKQRTRGFVVVLLVGLLEGAAAQEAAAPELQPLERYLGSWTYDGEDKTPVLAAE